MINHTSKDKPFTEYLGYLIPQINRKRIPFSAWGLNEWFIIFTKVPMVTVN